MGIKEWWSRICEKRRLKKDEYIRNESEENLDVSVFKGELWLYYKGNPVCPMAMFKDGEDTPAVIEVLRKYYIENSK